MTDIDHEVAMELTLQPGELATTIEALYTYVKRRLLATIRPTRGWKDLNWFTVQETIDTGVQAYTTAVMVLREYDEKGGVAPEFWQTFGSLPESVWELLALITMAPGWPSIPNHLSHDRKQCKLCAYLNEA